MAGALYMDAEIRPHRSLSARGAMVLIGIVTAANSGAAAVFVAMGAHFVPIFLAVDVVAVVVALTASFRSARWSERVQVSAYDVKVTHVTPRASAVVWESPTAFTRVSVERDEQDGRVLACRLALSGRETAVATALSPRERAEFAAALETAIWRARRGD
jgi:uncharacterized membrane protein